MSGIESSSASAGPEATLDAVFAPPGEYRRPPRILSIAGTDPTGGAGIQADLKSIGALDGYGMAVVTALVAQNTQGVRSAHLPPAGFLREQLLAVSDDVTIDAVKIGMLGTSDIATTVHTWLDEVRPPIVVLDPVMISTSGHRLLDESAEAAVRDLVGLAHLVTPNLAELAVLVGRPVATDWRTALAHAEELALASGSAVLVKGGHLDGELSPDAIVEVVDGIVRTAEVPGARIATHNTHGTGCSLSSAMATLAAHEAAARTASRTTGDRPATDARPDWPAALAVAKRWLTGALVGADRLDVGRGNGPIDHFHAHCAGSEHPSPSFSAAIWAETAALRTRIDELPFVVALGEGTLPTPAFEWYLAQDSLYLIEYSRVLARASQLAPSPGEQVFWAESAASAIAAEAQLHRERLSRPGASSAVVDALDEPSRTTLAYVDHLHASAAVGGYGELVAALLPCFWIYADVGERLAAMNSPEHPFSDWLASYGDPAFARATERAIAIADAAAASASADDRQRMRVAFTRSAQHELDFFAAPLLPR